MRSLRLAYGEKLLELGRQNPDFLVFDADLSESTQTVLFQREFPHRHFNIGIAENNMVLFAAGASRILPLVFASTFSMFLAGRSWEMIRNSVAHDSLNVKLVGTHAGISVGEDGSSHQIIEDIALMRVIPQMKVFCPADYIETQQIIQHAADHSGPMYIRVSRSLSEDLFDASYQFREGEGVVLSERRESVGLLITTGLLSSFGKQALQSLVKEKIFLDHIHFPTLKPLDVSRIISHLPQYQFLLSFEEHSTIGGLGDAILGALSTTKCPPFYKYGIPDIFGRSGKVSDLWKYFRLDPTSIEQEIRELVVRHSR